MDKKMSGTPELWISHDKKVAPYQWSHRAVSWSKSLLSFLFLALLLMTPCGQNFQQWVDEKSGLPFIRWLLFFGGLAFFWTVISFPFTALSFLIERKFQLSKQTFLAWLWDGVKGMLVGAVLGGMTLGLIYLALTLFPNYWWVLACVFLMCFSILLAQLAPVLLIPLFFKLKPMEPTPLKERLLKLCLGFRVEVKDVYHLGMGEKTEKGNAAFVGLGRTKKILIGDTLYKKFSEDEVEAVFAHELGHQIHNDLWKGIAFSAVLLFAGFYLTNLICIKWALPYFHFSLLDPLGMLVFVVVLSLVQMPMGILQAMFSRRRENAADTFAAVKTKSATRLADALEKLTLQNFGLFRPNPAIEFLSHSHPAPGRRISRLRSLAGPAPWPELCIDFMNYFHRIIQL